MIGAKRQQVIHIWLTPLEIRELAEHSIGGLLEWRKGHYQGLTLAVAPADQDHPGPAVVHANDAWQITVTIQVWEQLKKHGIAFSPVPQGDTVRLFDISRYRR